ncbi:uncharacterized protein LOC129573546 [Sitodiplosis mosellana]|uniref:uncharacterized protein LOC129573546 n=1 Tax=Sitodiplosis mosellana TaxID=263140 RepID=UPI002443FDD5|nr:uncharacterized protein LOC129573546 [Sitodiplosis mosellana]
MGIYGLKYCLNREDQICSVNIGEEVKKWKCKNPDEITPIVVIDFPNLAHWLEQKPNDWICGLRYQTMTQCWENYFVALKNAGCSLVFIAPWYDADFDINKRLERLNGNFEKYVDIYDQIEDGIELQNIVVAKDLNMEASKQLLAAVAKKYGDFHNVSKEQCHLEIVKYATHHNAMAILSSNTEFLIFDGSWKIWSTKDDEFQVNESNEVTTTEYGPNCLINVFALAKHQLPLFATLIGNKITGEYYDKLCRFHYSLGSTTYRWQNVARYVRKVYDSSKHLSDMDIRRLTQHVFGTADEPYQRLIRQSLDFYNLNYPEAIIDDPLEQKLVNTDMYRTYKTIMDPIKTILARFYDMRRGVEGASFSELVIDWEKRKVGILQQRLNDNSFTLQFLAKKSFNEAYQFNTETPVYPDFPLPPLEHLYLQTENKDDREFIEMKWKIFGWIMSFSAEEISAIKQLPTDFSMISAILLALVKARLIGVQEADGILYTTKMVQTNQINDVEYPTVLTAKHVRAVHVYNSVFPHMKKNFAIAGLKSVSQKFQQFDGVYFQNLMKLVPEMDADERETLFEPIRAYRIY